MLGALADAPQDDELWTEEDEAAVKEARDEMDLGESAIPHEEIRREFGI